MSTRTVALAVAGVATVLATGTGIALAGAAEPTPAAVVPTALSAAATPTSTPSTSTPTSSPTSSPTAPEGGMSSDEAVGIALRHVGGGRVTEIEREHEHGRLEWKVEVVHGGREHDVRVDAATGAITRTDVDDD